MTESSREHFLSDFGGVIRDPVPADKTVLPCRNCENGKLGVAVNGRACCNKCGRIHGLLRVRGKICYGVCL